MTALAATSLTLMSCSRFAARSAPARAIHTRIAPPTRLRKATTWQAGATATRMRGERPGG